MSDFFEDSRVETIGENHVEKLRSFEDREARRILKSYSRVRQELQDRLLMLDASSYSAQKTRAALYQIELALTEMSRSLGVEMKSSANELIGISLDDLKTELNAFDSHFNGAVTSINLDALRIQTDTSNFLFNRYQSSLTQYAESMRAQFSQSLMDATSMQLNYSETVSRIGKTFIGEEWRLHRIVRTELHNVYSQGKLAGMSDLSQSTMPDLKKTLYHPMDSRTGDDTKRLARRNPIVPIDEPFIESSTGKRREYMAPPNRPNDRAILIPYRESWKK